MELISWLGFPTWNAILAVKFSSDFGHKPEEYKLIDTLINYAIPFV